MIRSLRAPSNNELKVSYIYATFCGPLGSIVDDNYSIMVLD